MRSNERALWSLPEASADDRFVANQRPSASTSTSTSNASDGKWQHDLFGQDSDLYNPSINLATFSSRVPGWNETSPSLRPFGPNTPAAQALIVTPTGQVTSYNPNVQQAPSIPTGPAIGIKGTNAAAGHSVRKQQQRDRAELLRQRKELEKQRQETVKIAKEEELGFVVEVAGLVAGTSAEDVQASLVLLPRRTVERISADELTPLSPPRSRLPLARTARSASASSSTRKRATSSLASPSLATTMLRRHAPNSSAFRGAWVLSELLS